MGALIGFLNRHVWKASCNLYTFVPLRNSSETKVGIRMFRGTKNYIHFDLSRTKLCVIILSPSCLPVPCLLPGLLNSEELRAAGLLAA